MDPNLVPLTFRAKISLRKAIQRYRSRYECFETEVKFGMLPERLFLDDLERIIQSHYYQIDWKDRPDYDWWRDRVVSGNLNNTKLISEEECHELRQQDPNFRKHKKYVRNKEHQKKHRVEDPWRIEKKFRDRRGKFRNGNCCQPTSKKPYCKQSTRDHRAWQKQVMHREDYDLFVGDTHYINPWLWS